MTEIAPALLEVLICPQSRTPLKYDREKGELIAAAPRLAFPVHDGVPILALDDARELEPDE